MTIFSLVQPDKLANLFEMVAEALRQQKSTSESSSATSSSGNTTSESAPLSADDAAAAPDANAAETAPSDSVQYATMTLPCISFLAAPGSSDSENDIPLYMTVTLMPDDDVRKRCFHCVFTDCQGTNGKMGFITPDLLAKLFQPKASASEKIEPQKPVSDNKGDEKMDKKNEDSKGMEIEAGVACGEGNVG